MTRLLLIAAVLGLVWTFLRQREDESVSVEALAQHEARRRKAEPRPKADPEAVAALKDRWERAERDPKVQRFRRPATAHWRRA